MITIVDQVRFQPDESNPHTLEGAGSCPECRYILPRLVDCAADYFERGFVACGQCGDRVDVWRAALDRATRLSATTRWALASLGAAETTFVMPMETGKFYPLELTEYGVQAGARILSRHCTTHSGDQGLVTAVEFHPHGGAHRIRGTLLRLIAIPFLEGPIPRIGRVLVTVTWIRGDEADAWPYLVTAFESAAADDYAPALVFAQSAVEISLMPIIECKLRRHAPISRVKSFLRDSLKYSHALSVLLPNMCAEAGIPRMPDAVRTALDKMRKKRNDIIHQGTKKAAIAPEDAMEGLCASVFGFEFMRYVGPKLLGRDDAS